MAKKIVRLRRKNRSMLSRNRTLKLKRTSRVHPWQRLKVCAGSYPSWSNTSQKLGGGEKPPKKRCRNPFWTSVPGGRKLSLCKQRRPESNQFLPRRVDEQSQGQEPTPAQRDLQKISEQQSSEPAIASLLAAANAATQILATKLATTVQDTPAVDGDRRTEVD